MTSDFVHTQVVRFGGGIEVPAELNRWMLGVHMLYALSQGIESSQLVATDFKSNGQLQSVYPMPIPPKFWESKIIHKF
jgi:hypothetical protein